MNEVFISIIIPVYNVEKYIGRCLESCINQTFSDIEIICINDCSTDESGRVVCEYMRKYPNKIVYIDLEKNVRQGGARNRGIAAAKGKYLCFVDSDDYIENDLCEKIYYAATTNNADLIYYDYYYDLPDRTFLREPIKNENIDDWSIADYSVCFHAVKRSVIVENKLLFPENTFYEDSAVATLWRFCAQKRIKIDKALYHYVKREGSTMNIVDYKIYALILNSIKNRQKFFWNANLYEKYKPYIDKFIFRDLLGLLKKIIKSYNEFDKTILDYLIEQSGFIRNYTFDESYFNCAFTELDRHLVKNFISNPQELLSSVYLKCNYDKYNAILGYCLEDQKMIAEKVIMIEKKYGHRIAIWGVGKKGGPIISALKNEKIDFILIDNKCTQFELNGARQEVYKFSNSIADKIDVIFVTSIIYFNDIKQQVRKINDHIYIELLAY